MGRVGTKRLQRRSAGRALRLCDLKTKAEVRRFPGRWACFSRDGKKILSADGKTLYLSEAETGDELAQFPTAVGIASLAFSSDAMRALTAGGDLREKAVSLWNLRTGKEQVLTGHTDAVTAVAISADGRRGLSACGLWEKSSDKTIRLWDLDSGQEIHAFVGHTEGVTCLAFSADGEWALSGSWDKSVRLWQLAK